MNANPTPLLGMSLVPITLVADALALTLVDRLGTHVVEDVGGALCVPREVAAQILCSQPRTQHDTTEERA